MKKIPQKTLIDLGNYSLQSEHEGFCVFHSSASERTTVYYSSDKILDYVPEKKDDDAAYVGCMAYPNPHLKNQIPDIRFYGYETSNVCHFNGFNISDFKFDYKTLGKLEQSVNKKAYLKKISIIKELLAAGEIYQLNYAIRFRKKFTGNSYHLYLRMLDKNATRFSVFLNAGEFQVISFSPERLFRVEKDTIVTEPIKGTMAKSALRSADDGPTALLKNNKERSELDMITDLERNDIGKICRYGTLKITKERAIMELSNLWHTYSEIQGKLPKDISRSGIIQAMFPGGSITGCPKRRAMEHIEKLEQIPRNVFTGSLFFIDQNIFDASICIRTALIHDGYIEYWAGSGITSGSDAEKEYEECMLKAERFLDFF